MADIVDGRLEFPIIYVTLCVFIVHLLIIFGEFLESLKSLLTLLWFQSVLRT